MKNHLKAITLLFLSVFCLSCEEQLETMEKTEFESFGAPETTEAITVSEDGILTFATMDDFQKTFMWIKDLTDEEKARWTEQLEFRSLHSIYLEALEKEQQLVSNYKDFLDDLALVETREDEQKFRTRHGERIESFKSEVAELQEAYGNYVVYENNRVAGVKTYDPVMAALINKDGFVYVEGTTLQYTNENLKVKLNNDGTGDLMQAAASDEEKDIYVYNFTSGELETSVDKVYKENCYIHLGGTGKLMTGNTTVTNTVVPVYDNVWVPRVCREICPGDVIDGQVVNNSSDESRIDPDECYESCTGGYYKKVLRGYNYLNTRLHVIIRNYKQKCVIVCWETWTALYSEISVWGVYNNTFKPGVVEKWEWSGDISPVSSGTFNVEYLVDNGGVFGIYTCGTQVKW